MIALFVLFLGLVWLRLREFTASPVLLISQTAIVKLGNQADSLVRNKALAFVLLSFSMTITSRMSAAVH